PLDTLAVTGLGGAFQEVPSAKPEGFDRVGPDHIRPITPDASSTDLEGRPRVLWWAVERTDALLRAYNVLLDAVRKVGLSDQFLPAEYYPHVTLGSFSGANASEPKSWDVHGVPKLATVGRESSPATVQTQR